MTKLDECRDIIDEIDNQIIELFEERMSIVKNVIRFKLRNNIPVVDANREVEMLEKNLSKIKNEEFKPYYQTVLKGFLAASKDMQNDILNNK